MTTPLTGPFSNVPSPDLSDLAYVTDKTVSSDSCRGNSQGVSERLVLLNDGSLIGSETSLVESSCSQSTEFVSSAAEQNPDLQHSLDPAEGHVAMNLPESRYMYHLAFDGSMSLDLDRSHVSAQNYVVEVDDVKSLTEVAYETTKDSKPSISEVAMAEAVMSADEKECAVVETGAEETDMHSGPRSPAEGVRDREVATSSLPHGAETATIISHLPRTSTPTAVLSTDVQLAATGNNVSELLDRDHVAAVKRVPSQPNTCIAVGSPVIDVDSSECKNSLMDLKEKSSDCGWDGSPSDVGDDDRVRDRGAGAESHVIPVTSVQRVNTSGNVSVVTSTGRQAEVSDGDPSEDDVEYSQSTAVSASGEDLLVLVNFRITADRYEGSSVASETRESFSRMIVRQSDVVPKMNWSCSTPLDWADLCSTENRQFYLVRKKKTNVELSGEKIMMTSADDGRSSDFTQTNWYGRDVSNMASGGMRQVADRSVTKTTRVTKHVVVTKTETSTSVDDAEGDSPQNVYAEIEDSGGVDKEDDRHETTWITEIVRRGRLETRDSGDSGATDVGESGTTDYVSVSESYDHEDVGDSYSSGLDEVETVTDSDTLLVDTTLMVSSDDNTETTEITASDLNRTAIKVGVSEVREIAEHEIHVEFPDDDESTRSAAVEIMETDEAKLDHAVGVHVPVELQETEAHDVTETEPVDIFSVHPVSLESLCENTDVKMHEVENYVQSIEADDGGINEDDRLADIRETDTSVVRPDIVISEVRTPETLVIASKSISVVEDKEVQTPVNVDDGTADALGADSGMNEPVDSSKGIILADVEVSGDVQLEKVSDIEETDVASLSLTDNESKLYDTVLECSGAETFVQPVTHSDVICDDSSSLTASLSEVEACAVCLDVVTAEAFGAAARLEQRLALHADAVVDDSAGGRAADDDVVTELDMTETCSLHSLVVEHESCGTAVTEQTESRVNLMTSCTTEEYATPVDLSAVPADVEAIEMIHTAAIQNGMETRVQAAVNVDEADTDRQQPVTEFDGIRTCAVTPDVVTDDVFDTAVSADSIETSVVKHSAIEVDEQDMRAESNVAEICSISADVVDTSSELPGTESCVAVQIRDECDASSAVNEFTEPVAHVLSHRIVTEEAESISAANVESGRTETYVASVQEVDENEATEITALNELETSTLSCHNVSDENGLNAAVKSDGVDTRIKAIRGDISNCHLCDTVADLEDVETCNLDITVNEERCLDAVTAVKSSRLETYVGETVTDCAAALESVGTLNLDESEVCISGVFNISEASNAVFVNSVRFQSEREIIVRTTAGPMVDDAQSVETAVNGTRIDDGRNFDRLKEVKTPDIRMMSDACTETRDDDRSCLRRETQSAACQTDGDMADFRQSQQKASVISVGLQTASSRSDAATSTIELVDEDSKPSADDQLSYERDIVKTRETDVDISDTVISVHEAVDRMNILSTAVQTDDIDSIGSSTVETQTGSHETSVEPCRIANQVVTADVHTLATVNVAVVETQTLPCNDTASTTEAQTSTTPVDLISIHTQTIEHKDDMLIMEAETCTTPVEVAVMETQTSLDKDSDSTVEAQTSTDPTDLEGVETRQLEYEVTVESETSTTPVDVVAVETQTSLDDMSASDAQTSVTPVDLVMVATQTVWTDDDGDYLSHLQTHSIDTPLLHVPQIDQLHMNDSVQPDSEGHSDTISFRDVILQATDELEVSDSSSESIYLEDYSSSAETLFTDADEDIDDARGPDSSVKTDSDNVDVESVSEDMHTEPSESEYTDPSHWITHLHERDSCLEQSFDDDADHNGVPEVETFDSGDIPTSRPASPALGLMEWQPVDPDAVSSPSQVCSVASGCGDGWQWHSASFITCMLMHSLWCPPACTLGCRFPACSVYNRKWCLACTCVVQSLIIISFHYFICMQLF